VKTQGEISEQSMTIPVTPLPPHDTKETCTPVALGASPRRHYCTAMLGFFETFGAGAKSGTESRAENVAN
jgi:hypothetical protein